MIAEYYDSDARLPRPIEELVELRAQGSILRAFVERELKVRYKRSVFGVVWTLLNPLLLLVVLTLVFSRPFSAVAPSYPVFLIPGLLLWNFFVQTVTRIASEVAAGVDLWRRVRVPRTALAIATVISGLVNLVLATSVLMTVLVWFRPLNGLALLTLPVTMLLIALFTLGVALMLAAVALYFPDIADILQLILPALMFATPVIYPQKIIDDRVAGFIAWNPLTVFIESFRAPLYSAAVPSLSSFVMMAAAAGFTFAAGWLVFTLLSDDAQFRG
jgi:ABC-type polysaccharide/polyol phosphate export permease